MAKAIKPRVRVETEQEKRIKEFKGFWKDKIGQYLNLINEYNSVKAKYEKGVGEKEDVKAAIYNLLKLLESLDGHNGPSIKKYRNELAELNK